MPLGNPYLQDAVGANKPCSTRLTEFAVTLTISATFVLTLGWSGLGSAIGLLLGGVIAAPVGALVVKRVPGAAVDDRRFLRHHRHVGSADLLIHRGMAGFGDRAGCLWNRWPHQALHLEEITAHRRNVT